MKRPRSDFEGFDVDFEKDFMPSNKKSKKIVNNEYDSDNDDGDRESIYELLFGNHEGGSTSNNNHIYFMQPVNMRSVDRLIKTIERKNREFEELEKNLNVAKVEPKPLYLHICSPGGSVFACYRAVDAIRRSKIPIYSVVDGMAASAATIMSVVCDKRFITPSSMMLIHQMSAGTWGKFMEMDDDLTNFRKMMTYIKGIYVENTDMDEEFLDEQLKHDSWWSSQECLEHGLVDGFYSGDEE